LKLSGISKINAPHLILVIIQSSLLDSHG
jgi:hypothetical protein